MSKRLLAVAFLSVCCFARAAQQGTLVAGEYVIDVAEDTDVTLNADDVSALGSNVNLVKKGLGRLISAQDLSSWSGTVRVEAGYFRPTSTNACGGASATLDVRDPATCEYACTTQLTCGNVKIAGAGVGGTQGAIRGILNVSQKMTKGGTFTLTDDALVVMPTSGKTLTFDYGFTSFDMGGHTLTVQGAASGNNANIEFKSGLRVTNPGHIHACGKLNLTLEGWNLQGDASNTLTMEDGTSLRQAGMQPLWALSVSGSAVVKTSGWSYSVQSSRQYPNFNEGWKGPVTLNEGAELKIQAVVNSSAGATNSYYVSGTVSGAGALKIIEGHVRLSNAANSFTGGLSISGEMTYLHADSIGCVPSLLQADKFTLTSGQADITAARDASLTDANLQKIWGYNRPAFSGGAARLVFTNDYAVASALTGPIGITKGGDGVLTLAGGESGADVSLVGREGDLVVTGFDKTHDYEKLLVQGGTVAFTNAGYVALSTNNNVNYIGAVYPEVATLRIGTNSTLVADYDGNPMPKTGGERLTVGASSATAVDYTRGVLEIGPGGVLTNQVNSTGGGAKSMGSVFVRGGTLAVQHVQDGANAIGTGYEQQGYFRIDSGLVDYHYGLWSPVGASANGYGVCEQNGGTFDHSGRSFVTKFVNGCGSSVFRGTARARPSTDVKWASRFGERGRSRAARAA